MKGAATGTWVASMPGRADTGDDAPLRGALAPRTPTAGDAFTGGSAGTTTAAGDAAAGLAAAGEPTAGVAAAGVAVAVAAAGGGTPNTAAVGVVCVAALAAVCGGRGRVRERERERRSREADVRGTERCVPRARGMLPDAALPRSNLNDEALGGKSAVAAAGAGGGGE